MALHLQWTLMKLLISLFFFTFIAYMYAADNLIDALTQGSFIQKKAVEPTEEENDDEPKNQKIGFHYKTVPLHGFSIEVENNSLEAYAKALYQGEILDFGYSLTANTYLSSARAYSMDLNYALRRELTVGSRYSFKSDNLNLVSYTGVYSSLVLDELNKGLNIGIYYDKIGLDKKGDQFSLKIKNDF